MTEQQKQKIINLWLGGMSISQIAHMFPVTQKEYKSTIKQMKESGEFPTERRTTVDKVREMYESGITNPYEIAETYGISVATVRHIKQNILHIKHPRPSHNYRLRKKSAKNTEIKAQIRLGKKSLSQIARDFGVSRQRVFAIKKEMEI